MNEKTQNSELKKETSGSSFRVSVETKSIVETLLDEINQPFGTRRITPDKLIALLPSLITNDLKKKLRSEARTPEEEQEIWRHIYVRENGEISKTDFLRFMMTPNWSVFMQKHKTGFAKVSLVA